MANFISFFYSICDSIDRFRKSVYLHKEIYLIKKVSLNR